MVARKRPKPATPAGGDRKAPRTTSAACSRPWGATPAHGVIPRKCTQTRAATFAARWAPTKTLPQLRRRITIKDDQAGRHEVVSSFQRSPVPAHDRNQGDPGHLDRVRDLRALQPSRCSACGCRQCTARAEAHARPTLVIGADAKRREPTARKPVTNRTAGKLESATYPGRKSRDWATRPTATLRPAFREPGGQLPRQRSDDPGRRDDRAIDRRHEDGHTSAWRTCSLRDARHESMTRQRAVRRRLIPITSNNYSTRPTAHS